MLNNLPPDFPFVSNCLLRLTHVSAFRVPFMDISDALNHFLCSGWLFLITAETDWGPKIEPPWQLRRGLPSSIPKVAILTLLEQNGSFMTATVLIFFFFNPCLMFKRDQSFPYMFLVQTAITLGRQGLGQIEEASSEYQFLLRMLKGTSKGGRFSSLCLYLSLFLPLPLPSPFLFSVFLSFWVYGRVSDSSTFSSQGVLWRHKDRNVYRPILCHNTDPFGLNWGKPTATHTASI